MYLWYLPGTSTPTLLAIWWFLTVVMPRTIFTIFLSGFIGMFTLEYLGNTRSTSSRIHRLEADVAKTFPDQEKRLAWYRKKAAELEAEVGEGVVEAKVEKRLTEERIGALKIPSHCCILSRDDFQAKDDAAGLLVAANQCGATDIGNYPTKTLNVINTVF